MVRSNQYLDSATTGLKRRTGIEQVLESVVTYVSGKHEAAPVHINGEDKAQVVFILEAWVRVPGPNHADARYLRHDLLPSNLTPRRQNASDSLDAAAEIVLPVLGLELNDGFPRDSGVAKDAPDGDTAPVQVRKSRTCGPHRSLCIPTYRRSRCPRTEGAGLGTTPP